MKQRLDLLLTDRGLVPSRERAKALIMAGVVYVNGQKEDKAGTGFDPDPEKTKIEVRGETLRYVSALQTACCRTGQGRFTPSMWAMASSHGAFAKIRELCAWRRPISDM